MKKVSEKQEKNQKDKKRLDDTGSFNRVSGILNRLPRYEIIILFIVLFLVYNTVSGVGLNSGDVAPATLLPVAIVVNHNFYLDFASDFISSPDYTYGFPLVNGHHVSLFPIVTPVLVTPIYALSYFLFTVMGGAFGLKELFILAKTSAAVITALAGVFFYLSAKELFSRKIAYLVTFIFAFATSTWSISSQALWQHGTSELLLCILFYLIIRMEKDHPEKNGLMTFTFALGVLSALFAFNRPADSLLLIPILAYMILYQRNGIISYCTGGFIAGIPFLYYNYSVFGHVFGGESTSLNLFFLSPAFLVNYLGLLISPNVGLFVYCPILVISFAGFYFIWKSNNSPLKNVFIIAGIACLTEILLYSFYTPWAASSAYCYGPRFLTGLIPILCLYSGYFLEEFYGRNRDKHPGSKRGIVSAVIVGLIIVSVIIQFIGAFFYMWSFSNQGWTDERTWDVNDSVIIRSYTVGSQEMRGLFVYTLPPLPPLFEYIYPKYLNKSAVAPVDKT